MRRAADRLDDRGRAVSCRTAGVPGDRSDRCEPIPIRVPAGRFADRARLLARVLLAHVSAPRAQASARVRTDPVSGAIPVLDATNEGVCGSLTTSSRSRCSMPRWSCVSRGGSLYRSGITAGLLNTRAANYVGQLSYSLYLWQQLWLWRMDRPLGTTVLAWLALVGCALVSYYAVGKPLVSVRRRFRRTPVGDRSTTSQVA